MLKFLPLYLMFGFVLIKPVFAQKLTSADRQAILSVLDKQSNCWNKGDIDCFMEGYWKSDSLSFISNNEIMHGWKQVSDSYKAHYPDRSAMGALTFTIKALNALSEDYAYVVGRWELKLNEGSAKGGQFSLILQKIRGQWVIVADHTG